MIQFLSFFYLQLNAVFKKTASLYIISFLLFISSCNTTEPPEKEVDNTPPGSRDYEWTVDTLKNSEEVHITRLWGYSPDDLWGIGVSPWTATAIWHFDGTRWNCDSIPRAVNPWAVYGFSSDEVWLGNSNSTIWKYNGSDWSLYGKYLIEGYDNITINSFWGTSVSNIYGVGVAYNYNSDHHKAVIIHYDGKKWEYIKIPEIRMAFSDVRIVKPGGELLISGYEGTSEMYLVTWNGTKLDTLNTGNDIWVEKIGDNIYAGIYQKLYRYNNGKLELWMDKTGSEFRGKVWGRSEKDFFWCTYKGIEHYNGTDFQMIFETDWYLNYGFIFNNEVFFMYKDWDRSYYNIVIHGSLKKE